MTSIIPKSELDAMKKCDPFTRTQFNRLIAHIEAVMPVVEKVSEEHQDNCDAVYDGQRSSYSKDCICATNAAIEIDKAWRGE